MLCQAELQPQTDGSVGTARAKRCLAFEEGGGAQTGETAPAVLVEAPAVGRYALSWYGIREPQGDAMRATTILVGMLLVLVAACSTDDSMPSAFEEMSSDEVGCTLAYGDDALYVVGPLGPSSDPENVEPNDYTVFRFWRIADEIHVSAKGTDWGSDRSASLDDITTDGIEVHEGLYRDSGNPGYMVTCWRGNA